MLVTYFSVFTLREKFSTFLIWLLRYYLFTLFLFITRWFLTLICCQRYVSCMTVWINVCLSIYYATTHHSSHWKVREERKRERMSLSPCKSTTRVWMVLPPLVVVVSVRGLVTSELRHGAGGTTNGAVHPCPLTSLPPSLRSASTNSANLDSLKAETTSGGLVDPAPRPRGPSQPGNGPFCRNRGAGKVLGRG